MHQVALNQTQALGGEEARDAEGFELLKQVCPIDFIRVLNHRLTEHLEVLVDHLQVIGPVTEQSWHLTEKEVKQALLSDLD